MKKIWGILILTVLIISCDNQAGNTEIKQPEHNFKADPGTVNSLMDAALPVSPGLYGPVNISSGKIYYYNLVLSESAKANIPNGIYKLWIRHIVNGSWSTIKSYTLNSNTTPLIFPDINQSKQYKIVYQYRKEGRILTGNDFFEKVKIVTVD